MQTEKVEVLGLHLTFACIAKGQCDRKRTCINPNDLLNPVCRYLVAQDIVKKSLDESALQKSGEAE